MSWTGYIPGSLLRDHIEREDLPIEAPAPMSTSRIHRREEARARVSALRHNHGTYAEASRATGMAAANLSLWHRGQNVPRPVNMDRLRDVT